MVDRIPRFRWPRSTRCSSCPNTSGNKNSYYSYELNLVLEDGSRVNVVDQGNLKRLRSDAQTLSRFLDKPVWDATGR